MHHPHEPPILRLFAEAALTIAGLSMWTLPTEGYLEAIWIPLFDSPAESTG